MDKLGWCWKIKNGLELRESNANIAHGYLEKAKEALESMQLVRSRD